MRGPVDRPALGLYGRLLRLHRTALPWWLRAVYVEGAVLLGFVLYLADAASAWVMLALPVAIAAAVKVYDTALASTYPAGPAAPGEAGQSRAPGAARH